jgi:broad specificity phosphatase PhoE
MLIVVRHGRTAHNATRRLLGRLDLPLDELGERQAAALGRSGLADGGARVVSSPLLRARTTAEAFGLPIEIDERWIEIDYGIHDGMPLADVPRTMWSAWSDDPEWTPEGGESLAAVGRRVRAACEELWEEAARRDVVVVTHVSPIRAAVKWGLGLDDDTDAHLFVETASVSRIGPGRSGRALHSYNEIHHRPSA